MTIICKVDDNICKHCGINSDCIKPACWYISSDGFAHCKYRMQFDILDTSSDENVAIAIVNAEKEYIKNALKYILKNRDTILARQGLKK